MNFRRSLVLAFPLTLTACASGFPGVRPLTYSTPGEAHVYATGGKCVHETAGDEFAGLIAAALTGVASQLLKNFGAALTEGSKGGALPTSTAILNLQLDPKVIPKCVIIIRGAYQPTSKDSAGIDLNKFLDLDDSMQEERVRLQELKIPSLYRIDHYIELRLDNSANEKALTFAPLYVKVSQSIDGSTSGERDLSVSVKFNRAGADAVGSAVVIADRNVGNQASRWTRQDNKRFPIEAPWFGTFYAAEVNGTTGGPVVVQAPVAPAKPVPAAAPPAPVGGGGAVGGGGKAVAPGVPKSPAPSMESTAKTSLPVTLTATVVETRPTNEGLAFIAAIYNGIEPKIEDVAKPLIDSGARSAAEAAQRSGDLSAQADFSSADGAARAALITYCATSSAEDSAAGKQDRIQKSSAARIAQLKVNLAAIKADIEQPYANLIVISSALPSVSNAAICAAL